MTGSSRLPLKHLKRLASMRRAEGASSHDAEKVRLIDSYLAHYAMAMEEYEANVDRIVANGVSRWLGVGKDGQPILLKNRLYPEDMPLLSRASLSIRKPRGAYRAPCEGFGFKPKSKFAALDRLADRLGLCRKPARARNSASVDFQRRYTG